MEREEADLFDKSLFDKRGEEKEGQYGYGGPCKEDKFGRHVCEIFFQDDADCCKAERPPHDKEIPRSKGDDFGKSTERNYGNPKKDKKASHNMELGQSFMENEDGEDDEEDRFGPTKEFRIGGRCGMHTRKDQGETEGREESDHEEGDDLRMRKTTGLFHQSDRAKRKERKEEHHRLADKEDR